MIAELLADLALSFADSLVLTVRPPTMLPTVSLDAI